MAQPNKQPRSRGACPGAAVIVITVPWSFLPGVAVGHSDCKSEIRLSLAIIASSPLVCRVDLIESALETVLLKACGPLCKFRKVNDDKLMHAHLLGIQCPELLLRRKLPSAQQRGRL